MSSEAEWATERIVAYMWFCGDYEDCDCVQPVIERITPNRDAGYPWIRRERIWEGTFVVRGNRSPDDPEPAALEEELRVASVEHGLPEWKP